MSYIWWLLKKLRYEKIFGLEVSGDVSYSAVKSKKDTCQSPRVTTTVNTASNTKLTQKCTYISNLLRPINNYMPFKYFSKISETGLDHEIVFIIIILLLHTTAPNKHYTLLYCFGLSLKHSYIYCEFWRSIIKSPSAISLKLYLLIRDMPSLWLPKMYSNWVFSCRLDTGTMEIRSISDSKEKTWQIRCISQITDTNTFTVAWKMWQQHLITKFWKKCFESYTKVTSLREKKSIFNKHLRFQIYDNSIHTNFVVRIQHRCKRRLIINY